MRRAALVAARPRCCPPSPPAAPCSEAVDGPEDGADGAIRPRWSAAEPAGARSRRARARRRSRPTANSLWRTGARAFFNDQRAGRVGDILTVLINIDDSAKTAERHQRRP